MFSTINRLIIERGSYTNTRKFQEVGEEDSKKRDTPERYKGIEGVLIVIYRTPPCRV